MSEQRQGSWDFPGCFTEVFSSLSRISMGSSKKGFPALCSELFSDSFSCHRGIYLFTYCLFSLEWWSLAGLAAKSVPTACRLFFAMPAKKVPAISSLGSGKCKLCVGCLSVGTANTPRLNRRRFSEGVCKPATYSTWQTPVTKQETTHRGFLHLKKHP